MGGSCCKSYPKVDDDENSMERLSVHSEGSARSGVSSVGSSDLAVARQNYLDREERSGGNYRVDSSHGRVMLVDKKVNSSIARHGDNYVEQTNRSEYGIRRHHPGMGRPPRAREGEQIAAGWPSWLAGAAGGAIRGWIPRKEESFQFLNKIGQGTYSDVYRARDLDQNKIVALKRLRIGNLEPDSVRFMAREIYILRQLNHPNIIKLEGLVTSRASSSLFLVFEYMEHDLLGLSSRPDLKLTEPQVKCYMQQLFRGLDHCHSRGILHRDIKGSNLLVDNNGILKIADFGLATVHNPLTVHPMTSRVVTLWYRPPELLLGATYYGAAVDLWSAGCILAELFAGRPIMTGKTEMEQLHKIFKLCGTPSEDYLRNPKLPLASTFKPKQTYKRCIAEIFKDFPAPALALVETLLSIIPSDRRSASYALKSEFFGCYPLPCQPWELPKYRPSKELDLKERYEVLTSKSSGVRGTADPRAGTRDDSDLLKQKRSQASHYGALASQAAWTKMGLVKDDPPKLSSGVEDFDFVRNQVDKKVLSGFRNEEGTNNKDLTNRWKGKNIGQSGGEVDERIREHDRNVKEGNRRRRLEDAKYRGGGIPLPTNALFVGRR